MGKRLQSPDKHSVLIKGRSTSLTIEPDFWEQFRVIVMEHGVTVGVLLTEIERTMRLLPHQGPGRHRVRTLSAAVRVFVLQMLISRSSSGARRARVRSPLSPWSLPRGIVSLVVGDSRPLASPSHAAALSALTPPMNLRVPLRVCRFAALQVGEQALQQRSNVF
jgi:predicted DNA-binding ribbon-helix-helix protein